MRGPCVRRTARGRPTSMAGEGVVAPRPCPRPHLQGFPATGGNMTEISAPVSTSSTGPSRTLTSALPHASTGQQVRLQGWVHRRRELASVTFLIVRDRTGLAQVVLPAGTEVPPEETPIEVTGTATANQQAPGGVEVTEATVR